MDFLSQRKRKKKLLHFLYLLGATVQSPTLTTVMSSRGTFFLAFEVSCFCEYTLKFLSYIVCLLIPLTLSPLRRLTAVSTASMTAQEHVSKRKAKTKTRPLPSEECQKKRGGGWGRKVKKGERGKPKGCEQWSFCLTWTNLNRGRGQCVIRQLWKDGLKNQTDNFTGRERTVSDGAWNFKRAA